MTTFKHVFAVQWRPKFRIANTILALYGLLIVVGGLVTGFTDGWSAVDPANLAMGSGSGLGIVTFICLAVRADHDLTRANYRLLPTSETTLYLGNLTSTFAAFLYFEVVRALVMALGYLIGHVHGLKGVLNAIWTGGTHAYQTDWPVMVTYVVIFLLILVVGVWVLFALIHLAVNALSAFLPNVQQRVIKGVLAVLLVLGVVQVGRVLFSLEMHFSAGVSTNTDMLVSVIVALVITAAMVMANIYLLKHWVEARIN